MKKTGNKNFLLFIGIDPSINSTGIYAQLCQNNEILTKKFFIIKSSKLSKKEISVEKSIHELSYFVYNKYEIYDKNIKYENMYSEYIKSQNMYNLINTIKDVIINKILCDFILYLKVNKKIKYPTIDLYFLQEGISYGSVQRTKSVFDLAGLNFLLRKMIFDMKSEMSETPYEIKGYIISPPSQIKKFVTGNGNCKKEIMIELFTSMHGESYEEIPKIDDIADAYWMSEYCKNLYNNFINDTSDDKLCQVRLSSDVKDVTEFMLFN